MTDAPETVAFVRVLGPVQVVSASGRVTELPSVSQRRLLAVLALHNRTSVRAEWLADALDVSPGALRTQVSRLRKVLGAGHLSTAATGYRLDVDVDAEEFARSLGDASARDAIEVLEAALARWTGPALEEFAGEEWAAGEVARLTELHASAHEDLAAGLIAAGRNADAVALLETHVATYPLRDRPRGLLMDTLAGEGRQADALRAYQQYRTLLAEEVGTEPSAEVRAIEQRIATTWSAVPVDLPLHRGLALPAPLIGRTWERRTLAAVVAQAQAGGLQAVTLSGEAGIGKTTVLAAFAREAHDAGNTVLYTRCDGGAAVPLQPFRSLVGWCVEHAPTAALEAHVARSGGELQRIAPQLGVRVDAPDPTVSDDATERYLLFEAVADLLRRMGGDGTLVVMLDDLHWAEPTALALLRHLVRALADAPVALVVAFRDTAEHGTDDLRGLLAELDRDDAQRISVRAFDDAELADLVVAEAGAGAADVAARLRADSAGNPLYATQLIRHWVESGRVERDIDTLRFADAHAADALPPSLRDVVWSRVDALGSPASDVLTAGAVLGVEFADDVLAELVGLDAAVVDGALDAAIASGLLVANDPATRSMRFAHALVADALYAELPPRRRRSLHARAAQLLGSDADDAPRRVVGQLARHCALGGLTSDALRWATRAGDHALANLAPTEAASWYRTALDHCVALERPDAERADLIVRLGEARHRAGDPDAYATLREGAELAARCDARAVLVRAALATDRGFMQIGSFAPQQLAIVEAAVAVADPADVNTYARLLALFAQSLMHTPRAEQRAAVARQALDLATAGGDPKLLPSIAACVLYALWGPGASALRAEVAARAIDAVALLHDPLLEFATHVAAYTVAIERADPDAAARSLARLRAIATTIGAPRMRWTLGLYEVFEATMAARLDAAERIAAETLDLGLQIGEPDAFTVFSAQFFALGSFAGRHAELFPAVEQVMQDAPSVSPARMAYAIVCAAVGREDTAGEILDEGRAAGFQEIPRDAFWMTAVIGYAVLAVQLHDRAAAETLFPLIEPFAGEVAFSGMSSQGPISAYLGKLASLLDRHDAADDYLQAALATTTAFGWEYHRATTLIALAESRLRRTGALDDAARAWLDEADAVCRERGLRSWAEHIDGLRARATGSG